MNKKIGGTSEMDGRSKNMLSRSAMTTIHATKNVATVARQLVGAQDYVAAVFIVPPRVILQPLSLSAGPPGALSFAESVLQRSVLAHAPPAVFDRV
jgi:hypothetical protein